MAKKNNRQTVETNAVANPPLQSKTPGQESFLHRLPHAAIVLFLFVVTWIAYKNGLDNLFTDWDDKGYILNNEVIRSTSLQGLKNIFTTPVMGNYHPITILLYAVEYSFVQLEPWLYHFDSILFHSLVVILTYCFTWQLTHNKIPALVTALLFALHPMHTESVAWVAGRKDLLCALFYFASCIVYLFYTRANGKKKGLWYRVALLLFLLALLSKPIAVTLPLTLILIDYYQQRSMSLRRLADKIPFFLLSLIFGIISVKIQHGGGAMDIHKITYSLIERISLAAFALITYLWKAVLPADLHCFYPYPVKINDSLPAWLVVFPLLTAAITFVFWKYLRKNRNVVFGLFFFIVNIALLLQLIPVGDAIVAERYSYIPYFGLFFIGGYFSDKFIRRDHQRVWKYVLLVIYFTTIGYLTFNQCNDWHDTLSLWRNEISSEPIHAPIAYNNIGFYYFEKRMTDTDPADRQADYDSAVHLLNKAITLDPTFVNAHEGLGILYFGSGNFDSAAVSFRNLLLLRPSSESYFDYGVTLDNIGKKDSAITEYSKSISLDTTNCKVYLNRGILYRKASRWDQARQDFNKAIDMRCGIGELYYQRSYCDTQQSNNQLAIQDVEQAIAMGYKMADSNYYKSLKHR